LWWFRGKRGVRKDLHDDGVKTILGRTGKFDREMVVEVLLGQPTLVKRLAWRLCDVFLEKGVADAGAIDELAGVLRGDGLHVGRLSGSCAVGVFFSDRNLKARVAEPVSSWVATVRSLELFDPPPSTLALGGVDHADGPAAV